MDRSRLAIHFAEPRNRNVRFGRWASGNPFTFAMQPGTGRMYIKDVGSNFFEEINEALVGDLNPTSMRNYSWPLTEGVFRSVGGSRIPESGLRIRAWGLGRGVCYTGGAFYAGVPVNFPSFYAGEYFFADICAGWIKVIDPFSKVVQELRPG